jgi:hypothetical protein
LSSTRVNADQFLLPIAISGIPLKMMQAEIESAAREPVEMT